MYINKILSVVGIRPAVREGLFGFGKKKKRRSIASIQEAADEATRREIEAQKMQLLYANRLAADAAKQRLSDEKLRVEQEKRRSAEAENKRLTTELNGVIDKQNAAYTELDSSSKASLLENNNKHRSNMMSTQFTHSKQMGHMVSEQKRDNYNMMMGLVRSGQQEPFANRHTSKNPDAENASMLAWWEIEPSANSPTPSNDAQEIIDRDFNSFVVDISGIVYNKLRDISSNLVAMDQSIDHYYELDDTNNRIKKSTKKLTNQVDIKRGEVETNERRTVYESQVIDQNNRWKFVVYVIYTVSILVYIYYGLVDLNNQYSNTRLIQFILELSSIIIYVLIIDYILFHLWSYMRNIVNRIRIKTNV